MECPRCEGRGVLRVETKLAPWEEIVVSILDSLTQHEMSPALAASWLRMMVNYAEAK